MLFLRCQRGVSAVEFALVLPILLLLTFGIIEFSILLFDKAVITNASREGARLGVVYGTDAAGTYKAKTDAEICAAIKGYADGLLINLGSSTDTLTCDPADVVISPASRTSTDDLTVTVKFTYDFLVFPNLTELVGGTFDGTMPLSASTVMRME